MKYRKEDFTSKDLVKGALFASLIAVGAFISIPLGPVPFTLQNFFVFLAGLLLKPTLAFISVALYVVIGLLGLPIFAGFNGGVSYIFSPSFGFLLGFIIGAFVISKLTYGEKDFKKIIISLLIGEFCFYIVGLPYMYLILTRVNGSNLDLISVIRIGMLPFIVPDLIKLVIAGIICPRISKIINSN